MHMCLYFINIHLQGNFGEVWKATLKIGGEKRTVAIKTCLEDVPEDEKKKFVAEARLMRLYVHPNVVRFIGVAAQRSPLMLVMELISGKLK